MTVDPDSTRRPFAVRSKGLDVLSGLVAERHPQRILEVGSGLSTARLAAAAAIYGATVVSLEHDETYLAATRCEVGGGATVVHAPIRFIWAGALAGRCYAPPGGWDSLGTFDFAFIDGPPARSVGRLMTLPLIWPRLRPGALVVLHDANRSLEQRWLRLWMRRYGKAAVLDLGTAWCDLALITKVGEGSRKPPPQVVLEFWADAILHRVRRIVRQARQRTP